MRFIILQIEKTLLENADKIAPGSTYIYGLLVILLVLTIVYRERAYIKERKEYEKKLERLRKEEVEGYKKAIELSLLMRERGSDQNDLIKSKILELISRIGDEDDE